MTPARSHGFTLLEVLLALGLTAIILVALGMAIDFHFRVLDTGRGHVEEAQLARVLLRRIADDLRGAVVSSVQSAQPTPAPGGPTPNVSPGGGATSPTPSATPHSTPGVYGNSNTLQVDVSRLPQPYRLLAMESSAAGVLSPAAFSDVKTVTYFVNGVQGTALADLPVDVSGQQGLIRCEQDRAVAIYQAEHGGAGMADLSATLLAPEVVGIEFHYCDGGQWLDSWDTGQYAGLPLAVRVTVYIVPSKSKKGRTSNRSGQTQDRSLPENALAYSLVVSIPTVPPEQSSDSSESMELTVE